MRGGLRTAGAVLLALGGSLVLLELGVAALVRAGVLETPRPSAPRERFWDGDHPRFGVWHRPGTSTLHESACFRVECRANSLGARDRERSRASDGPRVLVLGDSFVEGWGVGQEQRLTELLERDTGFEHVNLAMAHFGPYQSLLAYRELGPLLEHDLVLIGIVPHNDFTDLDYERARGSLAYHYRYRPYLVGRYPDYTHVDHRESRLARFLRQRSYAWNALDHARVSLRGDEDEYAPRGLGDGDGPIPSPYYDYAAQDLERLRFVLERLAEAARPRPVVAFLVPTELDFERRQRSGPAPLGPALSAALAQAGPRVVDLLPRLAELEPSPRRLFLYCDYHWNAWGHAYAARVLRRALADELGVLRGLAEAGP